MDEDAALTGGAVQGPWIMSSLLPLSYEALRSLLDPPGRRLVGKALFSGHKHICGERCLPVDE